MFRTKETGYVTVIEAAHALGVTGSYVRRLLREKRMHGIKAGPTCWLIPTPEIDKYRSGSNIDKPRRRKCVQS